jgi:hypothetical protein
LNATNVLTVFNIFNDQDCVFSFKGQDHVKKHRLQTGRIMKRYQK